MDIKINNNKNHLYNLAFNNVTLKAGSKIIIENKSININYSNMVILKGVSGSGKSTLLKAIAGIKELSSGNIASLKNKENIEAIFIHCQPELNFLTGYIKDELDILGIKDYSLYNEFLYKSVYELNGGALKKISLLMALHISNGRIILADEPLDMLDDIQADYLSKTIIEYSKNVPFIIATHDKHFDEYADVIITL